MKVYIAKHYWKDGENATWECHEKVDKNIFEYLKDNYHNFVQDRNKEVKKDGYFIYPCYEDSTDIFGRDMTNITFFVSRERVTTPLCQKNYKNLELKIKTKRKNTSVIIGAIVLTAIAFLSITFLDNNSNNNQTAIKEYVGKSQVQNYSSFIDNWNQQVQNITDKKMYLLARENNPKLIEQLNSFIKPFYNDFNDSKYDDYKQGDVKRYKKFIRENHTKKVQFSDGMSREKIKKNLKEITNERDISEIVKEVLFMNDIEIFIK